MAAEGKGEADVKRSEGVTAKVTTTEKERIHAAAMAAGLSVGEWVRRSALAFLA